jgi:hypothetical protein
VKLHRSSIAMTIFFYDMVLCTSVNHVWLALHLSRAKQIRLPRPRDIANQSASVKFRDLPPGTSQVARVKKQWPLLNALLQGNRPFFPFFLFSSLLIPLFFYISHFSSLFQHTSLSLSLLLLPHCSICHRHLAISYPQPTPLPPF